MNVVIISKILIVRKKLQGTRGSDCRISRKRKGREVNERRVAEDRRDCYWLYVVTSCKSQACLQDPIKNPARFPWHEVKKVDHYYLSVDALTQPMQVHEQPSTSGAGDK
jgi:hypothetical protein